MIEELSSNLKRMGIFHQIYGDMIRTKKSKVLIPKIDRGIAYLIGVISGDGNLSMVKRFRGGFHYKTKVTSNSIGYLNYINNIFYQKFGIKGTITKDKRKARTWYLEVQNSIVFWYFITNGLNYGRKRSIKLPDFVKDKYLFMYYLSGIVDTDGSIQKSRIHLKQKNKIFLESIREKLDKMDMNPNKVKVNYTKSKPFYYLRFDNKLPKMPQ